MLKFYLETICIYFIIYITSGILFRKEFIKARDRVRKELNDNSKTNGVMETTFNYLIISCIPVIRVLGIFGKFYMINNTDDYIKMAKEKKNKDAN